MAENLTPEERLVEARSHIYMLLSTQPYYDEPPELARGAYEAVQDLETAARMGVEARVTELEEALRFTQEYIGDKLLPRIRGWSWYDALYPNMEEVDDS